MKICHIVLSLIIGLVSLDTNARVNPFANPDYEVATVTGEASSAALVELKLKAVMPSKRKPLANINGQLLAVGDDYRGYVLQAVGTTDVVLNKNGVEVLLELRPELAKVDL